MYLTIQHILNLSNTLNLNHNAIISKQHVITPHELYTHHTILIYVAQIQTLPMNYAIHTITQLFSNHFNLSHV